MAGKGVYALHGVKPGHAKALNAAVSAAAGGTAAKLVAAPRVSAESRGMFAAEMVRLAKDNAAKTAIHPEHRHELHKLAGYSQQRVDNAYKGFSGADKSEAPAHEGVARVYRAVAAGKPVEDAIAHEDKRFREYAAEKNKQVEGASKIKRGPMSGASVIHHQYVSPDHFQNQAHHARQMVAQTLAKPAGPVEKNRFARASGLRLNKQPGETASPAAHQRLQQMRVGRVTRANQAADAARVAKEAALRSKVEAKAARPPRAPAAPKSTMSPIERQSATFQRALAAAPALPKGQAYISDRDKGTRAVTVSKAHGAAFSHQTGDVKSFNVTHAGTGMRIASDLNKAQADRFTKHVGASTTLRRALAGDSNAAKRMGRYMQLIRQSAPRKSTPKLSKSPGASATAA